MCFHEGPGKFRTVITEEVKWGKEVVRALSEKVDHVLMDIFAKEGPEGYGDV